MKNKKSLGQNWLKNRAILDEIADLATQGSAYDFAEKMTCLEIGPGLGTLTSSLLRRFSKVVAVEFDSRLAENLPKSFPGKNLTVFNEDILKFDFSGLEEPYVIAGNIPYYITSPIIEKVLTIANQPKRIVLLVQKEVAERILDSRASVLSLFVKNRAEVFAGPIVKRDEFTPPPKVDSQVIVMEPLAKPILPDEVFDLIKRGFKAPRKKLIANLTGAKSRDELKEIFSRIGINVDARPADLTLTNWSDLYQAIR